MKSGINFKIIMTGEQVEIQTKQDHVLITAEAVH